MARTCTKLDVFTCRHALPSGTCWSKLRGNFHPPLDSALSTLYHATVTECILGKLEDVSVSEQKRAVQHLDKSNALAIHIAEHIDHQIQSTIKEFESNWYRRIEEAKRTANALNTDPGLHIIITRNMMLLKPTDKRDNGS